MDQEKKKINVKIIIPIIIAIVVIIGVIIAIPKGNKEQTNVMTKEEMLQCAIDISKREEKKTPQTNSYFIDLDKNKANAEMQKGKIFLMQDKITTIEKDYCEYSYGTVKVRLYLPIATLTTLNTGNYIKVVGQLADITKEQQMMAGMSYDATIYEFKNCYFIEITK